MKSIVRYFAVLLLPMLLATAFADGSERLQLRGDTMGTYYSIVIDSYTGSSEDKVRLKGQIESRLEAIIAQMSTWESASEISRFNASDSVDWYPVSAEFAAVVKEAQRIFDLTDGAFDPTVSPLIDLWGFGDKREREVTGTSAIEAALKQIGMQHLKVRQDPPALRKALPELQLNLSAIAKGYGVDALAELLREQGHSSFIVDIGGENRAGLPKASGDLWKIGVESPVGGKFARVVALSQAAVATSGDYRNNFKADGVVYSHTIDPKTGRPVDDPPASVSVKTESCMTADALATAMMVMGTQRGLKFAREHELSVMFQTVSDKDNVAVEATGEFVEGANDHTSTSDSDAASPADATANEKAAGGSWVPFVAAATIFLIAAAGMSIGVVLQNKSLKGSCGGLAAMSDGDETSPCQLCAIPKDQCTNAELREKLQAATANSDADG